MTEHGSTLVRSRVGHSFIKQAIADHDAVFGGPANIESLLRLIVEATGDDSMNQVRQDLIALLDR
ncbi:hypothetical protein [Kribbella rubisoli]|uniref:hypothetical protein n=1 Tax=Kribbella rubisoli TaxID=3075929 RepID=UPI003BAF4D9E